MSDIPSSPSRFDLTAFVRQGADGVEYRGQTNMGRSVYRQLGNIEKHMETQQAAGLDSIEDFVELNRKYDALLNTFAPESLQAR
ncbi:MAG TPA: hypothetical protein VF131_17415 [Blastocatellia bacterium]|nr:hypothetical protein [Blastocatellia bacterium]